MHYSTTVLRWAFFISPALAGYDKVACSGFGACIVPTGCNYSPAGEPSEAEWDCGSKGTITGQASASVKTQIERGLDGNTIVDRANFPRCDLAQPSATATLLKTTVGGVTAYGWVEYTCSSTTPITDACYSSVKNKSVAYLCRVEKDNQQCKHIGGGLWDQSACPK